MTMALERVTLPGSGCPICATNSYGDLILTYTALNHSISSAILPEHGLVSRSKAARRIAVKLTSELQLVNDFSLSTRPDPDQATINTNQTHDHVI